MRSAGRRLARVAAGVAALACATVPGQAEDIKGKWYFGGNLGILVTTDNVRSNSALIIAPLGADGAPFTGDKGELVSCDTANPSVYCDPRPDDLISRQTQLEQTLRLDGTIGYGLTSWLSLQVDVGYYKGDVNNFDVYTTKNVPTSISPIDPCIQLGQNLPCQLTILRERQIKSPISAATVTEIPVAINGIVRFRKDSNFNPYLGAGVGYLFTSLDQDQAVDDLNDRLASLHILNVTDEFGPSYGELLAFSSDGNAPFRNAATVTLDDGLQWQVAGGGEYFFNDRISFVFDARYVLTQQEIEISLNGQDQINVTAFTEDMFRSDGTLRVYNSTGQAPNPLDPSRPGFRFTCNHTTNPPPADYNGDGVDDACYQPAPGVSGTLTETVVVQGGKIRLTNFNFGFGIRFHF